VQHQPKFVIETNGDALPNSPHLAHHPAFRGGERRFNGAKQKWAAQSHLLEGFAHNSHLQGADVGGNVREFWHADGSTPT
jgi:hypothetical protein